MTDGQKDVDCGSDEQETSRREQHNHTDATPDAAAARWTVTAASTSTEHQPHDSTVGDQGAASATDGQTTSTEATSSATRRDRCSPIARIQRVYNE